jgi:predicted transcriptional regulator
MKPSPNKIAQARELYFNTELTQAQIADRIGVCQKTVSTYISENKWAALKKRADQMPAMLLEQLYSELEELNYRIASRLRGERFATKEEAEIRRKTMYSIATIKGRQSAATHTEVLLNFIASVARENADDARLILKYTDEYLLGEMDMLGKAPIDYALPPAAPIEEA